MQVKVFEAEDMTSALKKIKAALGPDAMILSTRTVKKGALGMFGAPSVEVTAAIEGPSIEAGGAAGTYQRNGAGKLTSQTPAGQDELNYQDLWKSQQKTHLIESDVEDLRRAVSRQQEATHHEVGSLRQDIDQLKKMVEGLARPTSHPTLTAPDAPIAPSSTKDSSDDGVISMLTEQGVQTSVAETIGRYVDGQPGNSDLPQSQLRPRVQQTLASLIQVGEDVTQAADGQHRLALVGPTGVGKTTTVAKLAAAALGQAGLRVALITIDTYRIAAVEQLKVYGDIMNVPVEVVLNPDEMDQALARHRDKDLILIDTAGRSPRDQGRIEELAGFLGGDRGIRTSLVLAANTRDAELQKTVERFGELALSGLIFTKLDECETFGALLNTLVRTPLPLDYMANGQRVPEDLLRAMPDQIAELILPLREDLS